MNFYIMTLFPEMVMDVLNTSILKRAMDKGIITAKAINIRDYASNKHNKVDDYTYGGGAGMLMQAQPIYDCYNAILKEIRENDPEANPRVIYVTPQGSVFSQEKARELSSDNDIIFLCGHYEGIDERVLEEIVTDYISIGDYVLTGGELPAMVMIDAVARLVPGVLNNDESAETESFDDGLLEYPQYSRPEIWNDKKVPSVLLSGNHQNVEVWRFQKSLERTKERRPELYEKYVEEHPDQFTAKVIKKRNKILDKIDE
ncbi:tRNA (guanosine(37)-N1)-methyltransferase TrmD [Butyrivibrio sp. VCD2006]|uniref:tRNA (guanosine(37)-N1)-methyltransferase TrmD n=1 Tax=Butyrivibrio sp. VCD2006 TaxID=1280664 RepID=UPI000409698B|nr:tRNA (guanosine(37)-N1)-methyltransferase TrmD [Butyrivibrio sp. VCD2006]